MPAKRELTMRQIRQMLRLHRDGVSAREIGRTLGVARSTVQDNLRRAAAAGLAWPLAAELTDDVLEQRLFARAGVRSGFRRRSEPDWAALARELKRPGVNLDRVAARMAATVARLPAVFRTDAERLLAIASGTDKYERPSRLRDVLHYVEDAWFGRQVRISAAMNISPISE